MNIYQLGGMILTVVLILALSIYSGTRSKKNSGGGRKNSAPVVAGIIMGTLVGGSSTVGTAQLAYNYGMSAWWFTLGGGISCLVLALFYVKPFRHNGGHTLVGMISNEFGPAAGVSASILSSIGTFINIISQMIAASAVLTVLFPNLGLIPELIITTVFMILYVVIGGAKGAGMVGILKLILLYVAMIGCGAIVLYLTGGVIGFKEMVDGIENPDGVNFFSLFARGFGTDMGAFISLLLGVLTTQTYAQAVLWAKDDAAGRRGALISTFMIPPIGIGGILVGLFMRANYPGIVAKTALTSFIMEYMPPALSGIVLGTLFIAVVGTGAGLALGISFIINEDILSRITHKFDAPEKQRHLGKLWITLILILACVLSSGPLGDAILGFAFMSMGLRATVVFAPLCAALFCPGRVDRRWVVVSIIASPLTVLVCHFIPGIGFDPLFIGLGVSILLVAGGAAAARGKHGRLNAN